MRALTLALAALATAAAAQEVLDWQEAPRCVGRVCSVRGTVAEAEDDGPVIRLYFDAERRDVYVTLVRGLLVTWPSYAGARIVATGRVDRFRDDTEIMVRAPSDVVVVGPPTPTAAATATVSAAPPPATPTPDELQRLRRRVRELEERLGEGAAR